ncbi:MAG TPA: VOC family protein [Candidatus Limnocylindrales bacterium]
MIGEIQSIVIDSADVRRNAAFYKDLAGWSEERTGDGWIALRTPAGARVEFQDAPNHVQPRWPGQKHPQQAHLDFLAPDRQAAVARAIELGATRLDGGGETFTVLADPSGHPFCLCDSDKAQEITLIDYGLDVPDGKAIAPFYSELLGLPITYEGDEGAAVGDEKSFMVMFQNVADYNPPRWPDPAFPQQFHLDIAVADIEEAERKTLALGAKLLQGGGGKDSGFRVYADPAGHPFCLCWGE